MSRTAAASHMCREASIASMLMGCVSRLFTPSTYADDRSNAAPAAVLRMQRSSATPMVLLTCVDTCSTRLHGPTALRCQMLLFWM